MVQENFNIKPCPRILFGNGCLAELPGLLAHFGSRALILTGAHSFCESDRWRILEEGLRSKGVDCSHERVSGEPSPEQVDTLCSRYVHDDIEVVAAVGGGSVLDCGKAVSAMLKKGNGVGQYLEGVGDKRHDGSKVPFIAVPTTAGTGSETTSNAVLSKVGEKGFKKSLRHDNFTPDIALIDPPLSHESPLHLKIHCAMDGFTQLVESYLSSKASFYTDDLAYGALRRLSPSLLPLVRGKGSLADSSNMAYGACVSGITLANAGLGVIHGFASVIGGLLAIPHGVVCATLMAACNDLTLAQLRARQPQSQALRKYTKLGKLFSNCSGKSESYYQDSFIDMLTSLTAECNIDKLSKYGVTAMDLPVIASRSACKNNPVVLNAHQRQSILEARL